MTDETKTTSEVEERLEKLTVSPIRRDGGERSETPPPRGQSGLHGRFYQSSPSLMETSPDLGYSYSKLPVRHHELTPIMSNTNTEFVEVRNRHVVSPDGGSPDGESSLSLPSASSLNLDPRPALKRRSVPSSLSLRTIPMGDRTKSLGHVDEFGEEDDEEEDDVRRPVEFPSRKKFFSFNSSHQYHLQSGFQGSIPMQTSNEEQIRVQYQPSREDLADVGALTDKELSRIFAHRNPIPLEERQSSIPSIHMANVLNGSTTDYTDDEDDLKDDASWSTRGSSLFLPEDDYNTSTLLRFTPTSIKPVVILEGQLPVDISFADDEPTIDETVKAVKRNRDDRAFEWLRTVETGGPGIAEAASSKFLTRTGAPEMISRQKSSPANFRTRPKPEVSQH